MLIFLGGVVYGVVLFGALIYFLLLTAALYADEVEDWWYRGLDSIEVLARTAVMLGIARCLLWIIIAFAWPIPLLLMFVLYLFFPDKDLNEMPASVQHILRWTFLGFGKFIPASIPAE